MSDPEIYSHPIRTAALSPRKPTRFDLAPTEADCVAIAATLGITAVRKVRFSGEIRPSGKRDFILTASLGATVEQPCVVTLAPVTTRIDETVTRRYIDGLEPPQGDEVEAPEDDTEEPLPDVIDLGAVLTEALALALPLYPRAEGAELGEAVFADDGVAPLREGDLKPFAGLAALREKLAGTDPDEGK